MSDSSYIPTIGLEIHAELATKTKMFCSCANDSEATEPNSNVCPVCLAHPGTLPTVNRLAVKHVLRVGVALGADIATKYSEFDRKSYFYPDIPKGYQISQFAYPFVSGGTLSGVAITRVHLEEDTARSTHMQNESLVDFNRAGVPLMELVTEPVIHDAVTAVTFARELQLLLRTLGVSKANLEKGEMRIEANISVSKNDTLGTKVEVKNLNSFRSVERAIAFEIDRQITAYENGKEVVQETRGWNEGTQKTFHQRFKEGSADYRYFPEPDIPKMVLEEIEEFLPDVLKKALPELPWEKRKRYKDEYGLKPDDIVYMVATSDRSTFFEAVAKELKQDKALVQLMVNYMVSDMAGWYAKSDVEEYVEISPNAVAQLMQMVARNEVSSRGAKDILEILLNEKSDDPQRIARDKSLLQTQDEDALARIVDAVLKAHPQQVEEFKNGKESVVQFLIGQSMKEAKGSGNPARFKEILLAILRT
ncbi:MAG TPA: Asp-tRNA(Asn)/Glu-tRNA(Gln) amidotransferase subunit GatB [Candidatus Kaiserbacteria bacterium]|nr:Asp-tRNA(Asn)/Glu-tRNA(Gln) amidotransferase subunit GatB [Candidatus Kaiserbacteria bacterium]